MLEIALTSFTTFFATIGPVEAAVLFATLTPKMTVRARAAIAVRATVIASLILLIFTFLGQPVLDPPLRSADMADRGALDPNANGVDLRAK